MKKKVLIFGPIGDFGGRDVEANIIAKSLREQFEVRFFSSIYISSESYSLLDFKNPNYSSFQIELSNNFFILKWISYLLGVKNFQKKIKTYAFVENKLSKQFFSFHKHKVEILKHEVKEADVIVVCAQLTSNYLKEIVNFSTTYQKPCLVRTTGTINPFKKSDFEFLNQVTKFIHHSEKNASNLNTICNLPYTIIDQCALDDSNLLALSISKEKPLRFGFLGRLSKEKGIIELVDYFSNQLEYKLIIAGNGSLLHQVLGKKNIEYIGQVEPQNLNFFFKKIDVLIISSYEESGPLVGLEAMAAGKIIISTDVGAMKDRLLGTKNDFWFDLNTIDELNQIFEKLNTLELEIIASSNREKYLKEYQFKAIQDKYLQLVKFYC